MVSRNLRASSRSGAINSAVISGPFCSNWLTRTAPDSDSRRIPLRPLLTLYVLRLLLSNGFARRHVLGIDPLQEILGEVRLRFRIVGTQGFGHFRSHQHDQLSVVLVLDFALEERPEDRNAA